MRWCTRYIALRQRDLYHIETEQSEVISNFAIEISDLCDNIKGCSVYVNQLLRCSSSIGANLHKAKYAQSKADFINKIEIALKVSFETEYWLEILVGSNSITEEIAKELMQDCGVIKRMLVKSINTAKGNVHMYK